MLPRKNSWNRMLIRYIIRFIKSNSLRPNHITSTRITTGLISCILMAQSCTKWMTIGGALWVFSTLLDRFDGEYARMKGMETQFGKFYDFIGDLFINSFIFLSIGIGRGIMHHDYLSLVLGIIAGTGVAVASISAELADNRLPPGTKIFRNWLGFEFNDLIYLIAIFAWCDCLFLLLAGAAVGGPVAAAVIITTKMPAKRKYKEEGLS